MRACLTRPEALQDIIYATDMTQGTTEQLQTFPHPGIARHKHRVTVKKTKGRVNIPG